MQTNYLVPHCLDFLHFKTRFWPYTFITKRSIKMSYLALRFVSTLEKQEGEKKKSFLAFLANKAFKNIGIQSQIPPQKIGIQAQIS